MVIQTERLRLRPMTLEDAPFMLKLLNEPIYHQNIGDRGVRTLEQCKTYLQDKVIGPALRNGFGLCIAELKDHTPVGFCGLIRRDSLPDVDIGFAFNAESRGKGYASEVAHGVVDYARNVAGLKRLAGIVDPRNQASIKVLEKIGMKQSGRITLPGETIELLYFVRDL